MITLFLLSRNTPTITIDPDVVFYIVGAETLIEAAVFALVRAWIATH